MGCKEVTLHMSATYHPEFDGQTDSNQIALYDLIKTNSFGFLANS